MILVETCLDCGTAAAYIEVAGAWLCSRCKRRRHYHHQPCPSCGVTRPLAYPDGHGRIVCAGCIDAASIFACPQCGREDHPYLPSGCARCTLQPMLTTLLSDPATGRVHARLQPLYDDLFAASRPQSVITWLQKPPATGTRVLAQMARGELPISHDVFQSLPADRSHYYLRDLLAATGVLPAYQPRIERMERWLEDKLAPLTVEDAALIGRYARWHLLHRLRTAAQRGELISKGRITAARAHVNGAIRLATWSRAHSTTVAALSQTELEHYLTDYPGARSSQQGFVSWLRRSRTNTTITIALRAKTMPDLVVSDDQRWDQVNTLLHEDAISLHVRIAGLFILLFAQPIAAVIEMRTDQIELTDDARVLVSFDTTPIQMPPILDELIRRYLTRPGAPTITSSNHGWLFAGRSPGRHLVSENFRGELVAHGIRPGQSRHAALFALASQIPAPVLADLVGIADKTATKWATLAARDWSTYIATRTADQ